MKRICDLKKIFKEIFVFNDNLKKRTGLTLNEVMIICFLSEKPYTINQLTKEILVSKSRTTVILRSLEKKGLLKKERSSTDGRKRYLILTTKGKKFLIGLKSKDIFFPQIKIVRKKKKIYPILENSLYQY